MDKIATRIGLKREGRAKQLGIPKPLRVIRLKCIDCSGGSEKEVRECVVHNCALWPYRMGRYPKSVDLTAKAGNVRVT
jgi:hypothetical protein